MNPCSVNLGLFSLRFFYKDPQDLYNVGGIHCFSLDNDVGEDKPGSVKKGSDRRLAPAGLHTCLSRARLNFLDPTFKLCFVSGVCRLNIVSSIVLNNIIQLGHGVAVDGGDELPAHSHSLLRLFLREKFGHPSG